MQYRRAALEKRPALREAIKKVGRLSEDGQTYFVPLAAITGLSAHHTDKSAIISQAGMSLADKVRMGLCGRFKTVWEQSGEPLRSAEANAVLKQTCEACPEKWRGMDKAFCRQQPCTVAGRWAATYDCPAGKWPKT